VLIFPSSIFKVARHGSSSRTSAGRGVTGQTREAAAPQSPVALLDDALTDLAVATSLSMVPGASSHIAILVEGLEGPKATAALGRYLIGALAGAIELDARLSGVLLARGADARAELTRTVQRLIGASNSFSTDREIRFRDTRRNAWIAEGVVHALLVLRARVDTACLAGPVRALGPPHAIPSQQGLDAVAIYVDGATPVVAIGESKASLDDGSGQLTEAASLFTKVDAGDYGVDLRSAMLALRPVLPPTLAEQVSDALWRHNRCYLPVIVHQTPFSPAANRPALDRLVPPVERRRLLAVRLNDFHGFFDAVADAMRAAVPEVVI